MSDPLMDLASAAEPVETTTPPPPNGTPETTELKQAIMQVPTNPLGLMLDTDNPETKLALIVLYGDVKLGKSTTMAKRFSDCLWLCAEPGILAFYTTWFKQNEAEAKAMGCRDPRLSWEAGGMARKTLPEYQADGVTPFPTYETLTTILQRYAASVKNGTCPYAGVVLDEYNVFADRVYNDMLRYCNDPKDKRFKTKMGNKPDRYGPPREIIRWANWVCSLARLQGGQKKLGLVCHPLDPNLDEGMKGGPKGPTLKSRKAVLKSADAIIRVYLEKVKASEDEIDDLGLTDTEKDKAMVDTTPPEFEGEEVSDAGYAVRMQLETDDLWEAGVRKYGLPSRMKLGLEQLFPRDF